MKKRNKVPVDQAPLSLVAKFLERLANDEVTVEDLRLAVENPDPDGMKPIAKGLRKSRRRAVGYTTSS